MIGQGTDAAQAQAWGSLFAVPLLLGLVTWLVAIVRTRRNGVPHGSIPMAEASGQAVAVDHGERQRRGFYRSQLAIMVVAIMAVPAALIVPWPSPSRGDLISGLVFAALAGVVYRIRRTRAPREVNGPLITGWLRTGRRRNLAILLHLLSYAALVYAVANAVFQLQFSRLSEAQQEDLRVELNLADPNATYSTAAAGGFLAAFLFSRWARRAAQASAADIIARDARPQLLLLRAFDDDRQRIRIARGRYETVARRVGLAAAGRLEEILAGALSVHGPVVAVARPGKRIQPIGAARESLSSSDWLEVVRARAADAAHVVVVVGETAPGSGLSQELEMLRDSGALERTIFVLPPVGQAAESRWRVAANLLGVDPGLPAQHATLALRVTRDAVVRRFVVTTSKARAEGYESAIQAAIESPEHRPGSPPEPPTAAIQSMPPAGWHPDPYGLYALRYWDGSQWTAHVHNSGPAATDRTPSQE